MNNNHEELVSWECSVRMLTLEVMCVLVKFSQTNIHVVLVSGRISWQTDQI